jgi:hypothetical protein
VEISGMPLNDSRKNATLQFMGVKSHKFWLFCIFMAFHGVADYGFSQTFYTHLQPLQQFYVILW